MGRKLSFDGVAGSSRKDWVEKTANYTASSGDALLLNSSGGAFTVTLPSSPSEDDFIDLADATGDLATNMVTLARNGSKICGAEDDLDIDIKNVGFTLVYSGATQGWRLF
ncbi:MAG: hypothetical protein CMB24_01650 [Euryarchaeota archaeon]|nr:hypothetical protein [Euryarchaeota archaeon]